MGDIRWNYLQIDAYERLVLTQGWPLPKNERWLVHAITSAFARDPPREARDDRLLRR